jgi:hypothetical protein
MVINKTANRVSYHKQEDAIMFNSKKINEISGLSLEKLLNNKIVKE